jgi:hypothetical protein
LATAGFVCLIRKVWLLWFSNVQKDWVLERLKLFSALNIKCDLSELDVPSLEYRSPDQKDYKTLNLCKFNYSFMFEQIQQEI